MDNHRMFALASLFLGLFAVLSSCLGYLCCCGLLFGLPGLGCGAAALVSASKDTDELGEGAPDAGKSKTLAMIGIAMCMVAPVLAVIVPFLSILIIGAISALGESVSSEFSHVTDNMSDAIGSQLKLAVQMWCHR